jgi:acyl-CoA thioester hydrolase
MNTFRVSRIVEFCDTDMAGIVHFANFFRFMEAAEHAYLRACGLSVVTTWKGQEITFPRVSAACDYLRPARFQDELVIEVRVERIGRTSISYRFMVSRAEDEVARGQITAVLCRVRDGHALEPFPFPDELRQRIAAGPGV